MKFEVNDDEKNHKKKQDSSTVKKRCKPQKNRVEIRILDFGCQGIIEKFWPEYSLLSFKKYLPNQQIPIDNQDNV